MFKQPLRRLLHRISQEPERPPLDLNLLETTEIFVFVTDSIVSSFQEAKA